MVANQITNCHQSIDAGSWSTAGPKTKTGEAKGETNPELVARFNSGAMSLND